jgi:hypothetical protein
MNPQPRNEPAWCSGSSHDQGIHHSRDLRVGAPSRDGGQGEVAVWLRRVGAGPTTLLVNVADGIGVTAEVSLEDAYLLRDYLNRLLHAAEQRPRNERG